MVSKRIEMICRLCLNDLAEESAIILFQTSDEAADDHHFNEMICKYLQLKVKLFHFK